MTYIALFFCLIGASGQGKSTLIKRINEIKSQNDTYYWNQYTGYNGDTAKVNATKWLLLEVNDNRPESEQLTVDELMRHAKYITIDRGNAIQYFTYIEKSEAAAINRQVRDTSPSYSVSSSHSASTSQTDVAAAPQNVAPEPARHYVPDAFVQRVMQTEKFIDVYKLLKSLQAQGEILQFGKLRDVEDYSSLDLILFDMKSQEFVTMLSGVTANGSRINLVSGYEDSLSNYPTNMTAVIWYIAK